MHEFPDVSNVSISSTSMKVDTFVIILTCRIYVHGRICCTLCYDSLKIYKLSPFCTWFLCNPSEKSSILQCIRNILTFYKSYYRYTFTFCASFIMFLTCTFKKCTLKKMPLSCTKNIHISNTYSDNLAYLCKEYLYSSSL